MEIEQTLARYGATSFASGWQGSKAVVVFEAHKRRVKFILPLPDKAEFKKDPRATWRVVPESVAQEKWEQEVRRLWRSMLLAIKAKLEVVNSGIATFEEEFLSHVVLPDGRTFGEWAKPQLDNAYERGHMPPLLTSGE